MKSGDASLIAASLAQPLGARGGDIQPHPFCTELYNRRQLTARVVVSAESAKAFALLMSSRHARCNLSTRLNSALHCQPARLNNYVAVDYPRPVGPGFDLFGRTAEGQSQFFIAGIKGLVPNLFQDI